MAYESLTELLSLRKVSEILNVHPNTLRHWDKKGILKSVRFGQRKDRHYRKEDVLKLVEQQQLSADLPEDADFIGYKVRKTIAEESLDRLSYLQSITSALSKTLTIKDVVTTTLNQLTTARMSDNCCLLLMNDKEGRLEIAGFRGSDRYVQELGEFSLDSSNPYLDVLRTGDPLLIESSHEYLIKHALSDRTHITHSQSLAILPLVLNSTSFGILTLSFIEARQFNKDDTSFFQSVARQCTLALERAHLYEAEQKTRLQFEEVNGLLQNVYLSSQKFLIPLTLEETYRTILEEATKLVGSDYGNINLYNSDKDLFIRTYSTAPKIFRFPNRRGGRVHTAFFTNQPVINQVNEKEPHKEHLQLGSKTVIYLPMTFRSRSSGVIVLIFLNKKLFHDSEVRALQLYCSLASLAVQNAQKNQHNE